MFADDQRAYSLSILHGISGKPHHFSGCFIRLVRLGRLTIFRFSQLFEYLQLLLCMEFVSVIIFTAASRQYWIKTPIIKMINTSNIDE